MVSPCILCIKVPTPVYYDHSQGEGKEPNDEKDRLRVAAIEEAQHGQEQQQPKEDVQVPARKFSQFSEVSELFYHFPALTAQLEIT